MVYNLSPRVIPCHTVYHSDVQWGEDDYNDAMTDTCRDLVISTGVRYTIPPSMLSCQVKVHAHIIVIITSRCLTYGIRCSTLQSWRDITLWLTVAVWFTLVTFSNVYTQVSVTSHSVTLYHVADVADVAVSWLHDTVRFTCYPWSSQWRCWLCWRRYYWLTSLCLLFWLEHAHVKTDVADVATCCL